MRILTLAILIVGTAAAQPRPDPGTPATPRPLAPTVVTWEQPREVLGKAAADLANQSGVHIQVAPGALKAKFGAEFKGFKGVPFWEGLQQAADATGTRISLADGGRRVQLVPRGKARDVAATSGAFRVAAQQVVGRALLDEGVTYHEVHLLVHWEPRLRVYRIDSTPAINTVEDVPGTKLTAEAGGAQLMPLDATSEMKVRVNGLRRTSEKITTLAGVFLVTAAEKMLAFSFASDRKSPVAGVLADGEKSPVSATLKRLQKKDDTWEAEVEVMYPPGQPVFESFQGEWWLRDNRFIVRSPQGKSFVIEDYEVPTPDDPRPLRAVYRFKEDPKTGLGDPTQKGWSIVYETPSPLHDVKVPFELKTIPLP